MTLNEILACLFPEREADLEYYSDSSYSSNSSNSLDEESDELDEYEANRFPEEEDYPLI